MSTDIGYSRLLFYFGLLGFFVFMAYQFALIKLSTSYKYANFIFFTYFLVLNLKGFVDLTSIFVLFLLQNFFHKITLKKQQVL